MADWRNPDDYSYTKNLALRQWAWEFLRRNREYQAKWAIYRRKPISAANLSDFYASIPFGLRMPYDPSLTALEHGEILWMEGSTLVDTIDIFPSRTRGDPWPGFPRYIPLFFRADWSVEALLEAARPLLEEAKAEIERVGLLEPWESSARFSADRFCGYLRLLDAQAAGVSKRAMARELFPNQSDSRGSVRSALKKAQQLANGGYQALVQRPEQ